MTDPIADFMIRIKNGYSARQSEVSLPYSRLKEQIGRILVKEGYLEKMEIQGKKLSEKTLQLKLKYLGKKPAIKGIKRISRPSLRIYAKADQIPPVRYGFGITLISTSGGLKTDSQAKKEKLGGEVIAQIW